MSAEQGLVTGASFPTDATGDRSNPSSPSATGVATGFVGMHMPTDGGSFAALTNGDVGRADPPNDSGSAGSGNGTAARSVYDLTVLRVDINVPAGHNCLAVDTVFYSEEYPEYVGSQFNDGFIAELDTNDWSYDSGSNTVTAPHNFAFDEGGHVLSVNSVSFTDGDATGLQYDGSTRLLSSQTSVTPGNHTLYFTVYDAGDNVFDSAAFLDNLRSYQASDCNAGSDLADDDGDGLPNSWETQPVDTNDDGTPDLDLPAMGADPEHKDLFVEIDSMPSLKLEDKALTLVRKSFDAAPVSNPDGTTGIHLHADNGPQSVMNPVTGATWGSLSQANTIPYQQHTGSFTDKDYQWGDLDTIKAANFDAARAPAFRYAISANRYGAKDNTSSGIARDIPSSDFIVSLGSWCEPEGSCLPGILAQAGTFMHELGHTLGLHHGGQKDTNNVPNYLSIMNYDFQTGGLDGSQTVVDYSRFSSSDLPTLDENDLSEPDGFNPQAAALLKYSTFYHCDGPLGIGGYNQWAQIGGNVDFNCDDDTTDNASEDLNNDGDKTTLTSYEDWHALQFRGGAVGGFGLSVLLNDTTTADEAPSDELQQNTAVLIPPPDVQTGASSDVTDTTATLSGQANPHGHPAQVRFSYGTSEDNMTFTDWMDVGSSDADTPFSQQLHGLSPGTTYLYRAVVRTDAHLLFGATGTVTTSAAPSQPGPALAAPVEPPGPQPGSNNSTSKTPDMATKPVKKAAKKKPMSCAKQRSRARRQSCVLAREQAKCRKIKNKKKAAKCRAAARKKARHTK